MNEFTKEELQIILLDMDTYIQQSKILKESPIHGKLRLKIQLMIEYLTPEKPKSICECGDEYHPNGFVCLKERS